MNDVDQILQHAEQKKATNDPVKAKQVELAPVRENALKLKQDFEANVKRLQPRIAATLNQVNRLTSLTGGLPSDLRCQWEQLQVILRDGANCFDEIVGWVDYLTIYDLNNHCHPVHTLDQRLRARMSNISAPGKVFEKLESTIKECAEALGRGQGLTAVKGVSLEKSPAEPKVDTDFTL